MSSCSSTVRTLLNSMSSASYSPPNLFMMLLIMSVNLVMNVFKSTWTRRTPTITGINEPPQSGSFADVGCHGPKCQRGNKVSSTPHSHSYISCVAHQQHVWTSVNLVMCLTATKSWTGLSPVHTHRQNDVASCEASFSNENEWKTQNLQSLVLKLQRGVVSEC